MKISLIIAGLLIAGAAQAATLDVDRFVEAIRITEGVHSKHPYGVLSVKVSTIEDAKRVCTQTVTNNWKRWQKAGCPGLYITFIANRYCPPSADPKGNINWKKNVTKFYGESI